MRLRSLSAHLFVAVFLLSTAVGGHAQGESGKKNKPLPGAAVPDDSDADLKDYVPCLMDRQSLYAMRGRNESPSPLDINAPLKLTDAEKIVKQSSEKITDPDSRSQFISNADQDLVDKFQNSNIVTLQDVLDIISTDAKKPPTDDVLRTRMSPQDVTDQASAVTQDAQLVASSALSYPRPKDIGCSMSIYPWSIAHMVFGRTVANHYLAVQVTVRNLDPDHEFLIHDAELAVDAYSGQLERFQEANEKQAVRGVSIYGQTYDRRAIFSHAVESIGIIMGAVVGLPQPSLDNLTAASGSYAAGFMPGFQKLFPDLSTNNLNNLNDLGFSAAAASRIVVPKGGSVPFVIFIPLKPLEQACWLQPGYIAAKDFLPNTACDAIYLHKKDGDNDAELAPVNLTKPETWQEDEWPLHSKFKNYSKWSPGDLTALQKHAYAVVAGMHIAAVDSQAASLRILACTGPANSAGTLSLGALGTGASTCTLSGANLVNVMTLRLKSASTSLVADVPVIHASDSTTATANLTSDITSKLTDPTYNLFGVDSTGKESDLKLTYTVLPAPAVTAAAAAPSSVAGFAGLAAGAPMQLTLTGTNLAQIQSVELHQGTNKIAASTSISATSGQVVAKFATAGISAGAYEIYIILNDTGSTAVDSKQPLTL